MGLLATKRLLTLSIKSPFDVNTGIHQIMILPTVEIYKRSRTCARLLSNFPLIKAKRDLQMNLNRKHVYLTLR